MINLKVTSERKGKGYLVHTEGNVKGKHEQVLLEIETVFVELLKGLDPDEILSILISTTERTFKNSPDESL